MDKTYYRDHLVNKEHLHSKVYKEVPLDSDKPLLVEKYKSNLTSKEIKYLTDFKWQSSNIYCTPKIHKCKSIQEAIVLANDDYIEIYQPDDLRGRPIISGPESPTQCLSCIIETLLKPIVPLLITYRKDDWEFIQFLPRSLTFDSNMYFCDIESLYTSVPTELGREAIEYWIMKKQDLIPQRFTKEFILESIEFIFKNFYLTLKCLIRSLKQPWAQNVLVHLHVSPLVLKKKLNCLCKSYQNLFPMKSVY